MAEEVVPHTPRRLQQVSTIATRKLVVMWMVQDEMVHGFRYLFQRSIVAFPEHFRAEKNTNLIRAKRWWTQRHLYCTKAGEANWSEILLSPTHRISQFDSIRSRFSIYCPFP